ncbi:hypothetical protein J7L01_06930 [bacterium]|nr:hypothetical protein [bacterium]
MSLLQNRKDRFCRVGGVVPTSRYARRDGGSVGMILSRSSMVAVSRAKASVIDANRPARRRPHNRQMIVF